MAFNKHRKILDQSKNYKQHIYVFLKKNVFEASAVISQVCWKTTGLEGGLFYFPLYFFQLKAFQLCLRMSFPSFMWYHRLLKTIYSQSVPDVGPQRCQTGCFSFSSHPLPPPQFLLIVLGLFSFSPPGIINDSSEDWGLHHVFDKCKDK